MRLKTEFVVVVSPSQVRQPQGRGVSPLHGPDDEQGARPPGGPARLALRAPSPPFQDTHAQQHAAPGLAAKEERWVIRGRGRLPSSCYQPRRACGTAGRLIPDERSVAIIMRSFPSPASPARQHATHHAEPLRALDDPTRNAFTKFLICPSSIRPPPASRAQEAFQGGGARACV
jgi:hypothetical protein